MQCNFSNSFHNNIHLKLLENCESEFTLMVVNHVKQTSDWWIQKLVYSSECDHPHKDLFSN